MEEKDTEGLLGHLKADHQTLGRRWGHGSGAGAGYGPAGGRVVMEVLDDGINSGR